MNKKILFMFLIYFIVNCGGTHLIFAKEWFEEFFMISLILLLIFNVFEFIVSRGMNKIALAVFSSRKVFFFFFAGISMIF